MDGEYRVDVNKKIGKYFKSISGIPDWNPQDYFYIKTILGPYHSLRIPLY